MRKNPRLVERERATFAQLCAIAKAELVSANYRIDDIEWKERIQLQATRHGFRSPFSHQVYQVIEAVSRTTRRLRPAPPPPPTIPPPAATVEAPRPTTANVCGCSKAISGARPLRCSLPRDHAGDHGCTNGVGLLIVRWAREDGE